VNLNSISDICGIDEAGRGPWAGPLVVSGVVFNDDYCGDGLTDSKKLTPKKREQLFEDIIQNSSYHIVQIDNKTIDSIGLSKSIQNAILEIKSKIITSKYIFDGNTTFGIDGIESMVKADLYIPQVSAASILAKVTRDRYMIDISQNYPEYQFEKHKGYITKLHKDIVIKYGLSDIHRKSYKVKGIL
jgi:ribonuclease HII